MSVADNTTEGRIPPTLCKTATDSVQRNRGLLRRVSNVAVMTIVVLAMSVALANTENPKPDHIRGQITAVEDSAIVIETSDGTPVRLETSDDLTIFGLTKASFIDVDFGTYVGAVSVRLDDYSPIVRDSLSWLHKGFELRIIDEELRGIAVGHDTWDLTSETVVTHGWVDDLEIRVLSIKFGPTEEEETDVDIPRDVPIHRMSLGEKSLIKPGAHVFAGARKGSDGDYVAAFVFIGEEGVKPAM